MTDIEQRAHNLTVAYVTNSYAAKHSEFEIDETHLFEFGTAYECAYKWIIKSLEEKNCF